MTTEKQIEANHNNALLSTGPKTSIGKDKVRLNAVKHGLLSQAVVLSCESKSEFEELERAVIEDLAPVGIVEHRISQRILSCLWKLRRAEKAETYFFDRTLFSIKVAKLEREASKYMKRSSPLDLKFPEVETILNEAKYRQIKNEITRTVEEFEKEPTELAGAVTDFRDERDRLAILNRYESYIERSLYRAIREFREMRTIRIAVEFQEIKR